MTVRTTFGAACLLAAAGLAIGACGDPDPAGSGATESSVTSGSTVETQATTAPPTTALLTAAATEECDADRRTFEVAVEAYIARYGAPPATEAELVTSEMLLREFGTYDLVAGEIVRVPGTPCELEAPDGDGSTAPVSADDVYATFGDEDIDALGGPECAREFAEIGAAASRFEAREGRSPEDLDAIRDDLDVAVVLWAFDPERQALVPADGSPCTDFMQDDTEQICSAELKTLEVASEAYLAIHPGSAVTEADLVAEGLLRAELDDFDLVDGKPVAVPDGRCVGVLPPATTLPPAP